jgi:hypothetical protein
MKLLIESVILFCEEISNLNSVLSQDEKEYQTYFFFGIDFNAYSYDYPESMDNRLCSHVATHFSS